jgi:molybdopterin-guanine dinucleotide biosynthesis protein B
LRDHGALTRAHHDVAQDVARHVPEQAVEHVRLRELGGTPMEREDVGDQLALHLPDQEQIGQHGKHPERSRRQRERARKHRGLLRGFARELRRLSRGVRCGVHMRRRHVGDDALDQRRNVVRSPTAIGGVDGNGQLRSGRVHWVASPSLAHCVGSASPLPRRGRAPSGRPCGAHAAMVVNPPVSLASAVPCVDRRAEARAKRAVKMVANGESAMRIFGFAGWSGSGKTTLIEQLIPRLAARGLRVSLIKHAHHTFDIDQPGKDSYRHRHAGCAEVLVTSNTRWALMHELRGGIELTLDEALGRLSPCDLALVEGFKTSAIPKLEVWRAAVGKPLLHLADPHIVAIATDSPGALPPASAKRLPVVSLDDYDAAATLVVAHAQPAVGQD